MYKWTNVRIYLVLNFANIWLFKNSKFKYLSCNSCNSFSRNLQLPCRFIFFFFYHSWQFWACVSQEHWPIRCTSVTFTTLASHKIIKTTWLAAVTLRASACRLARRCVCILEMTSCYRRMFLLWAASSAVHQHLPAVNTWNHRISKVPLQLQEFTRMLARHNDNSVRRETWIFEMCFLLEFLVIIVTSLHLNLKLNAQAQPGHLHISTSGWCCCCLAVPGACVQRRSGQGATWPGISLFISVLI